MPKDPKFSYYLTTRGLNNNGVLLSLQHLPEWFHPFVTVISVEENKAAITKKYPLVKYWANPVEINTATLKRQWIFNHSPTDQFFLLNDEIKLYTSTGEGKARSCNTHPEDFRKHLLAMEDLANYYVGISAHQKLFSMDILRSHSHIRENYIIGSWFYWNRKFVLSNIKLNRVNYYDDIDYTLQALKLGYRVCNYGGLLYDQRTAVPQRQHSDRTVELQMRDSKRMIEMHPESVSWKEGYDPLLASIGISLRFSPSYKPKKRVLVLYSSENGFNALGAYLAIMKSHKSLEVKIASLGEASTNASPRALWALRKVGLPSQGVDGVQATIRMLNSADVVLLADGLCKANIAKHFPKVPTTKLFSVFEGEAPDYRESLATAESAVNWANFVKSRVTQLMAKILK